mmetsp:Transcript_62748/g.180519  ORF Transcript_62748/g.180519 Transcript_62748/m.180519 type:complete len:247 (-) Transcript_62748:66-806(-)
MGLKKPSSTTQRLIEGKLTSLMLCISFTMSCRSAPNCCARTCAPLIFNGRMSRRTASRRIATESSKLGAPMRGTLKNLRSEKDWSTSWRFSRRPASVCSDLSAFSKVSGSYRKVFLFTTKTSRCSGRVAPSAKRMRDLAASEAPKFCNAASEKLPPATKTTSAPMTMPKTLTRVLIAAMALLPPSQSSTSMCIWSCAAWAASFSKPGKPARSCATGKTTQSMPSVTGSAESLEMKASSRPKSLDAR